MRRPVNVNCVFLCLASPGWRKSVAGEEHVKAERSKFILSLDGGRAGIIENASGRSKTRSSFRLGLFARPSNDAVATLPSALLLSDMRSVQVGCSRFSRCCHLLLRPFTRSRRRSVGPGQ
jgi:hypothetical protein